jgi:hypothetical protein
MPTTRIYELPPADLDDDVEYLVPVEDATGAGNSKAVAVSALIAKVVEEVGSNPGPQGDPGVQGDPGPQGVPGKTVLSGSGVPSSGLGANGDFYINTAANTIYGPKAGGAWGSATSLVGPTGSAGTAGLLFEKNFYSISLNFITAIFKAIS